MPSGTTGFYLERTGDIELELALLWTESTDEHIQSYVNGIPTSSGGTHDIGLKAGVVKAVRNYIEHPRPVAQGASTLTAEDIREGMVGDPVDLRAGAAVPGPDQGAAQQPRGRRPRSTARCAPRSSSASTRTRAWPRRSSRASSWPRGRARRRARRRRRCRARRRSRTGSTCPASWPTARRPTRPRASCSSSRATRPAARPSRAATARPRRSSRCAARCSTPSRPRPAKVIAEQGAAATSCRRWAAASGPRSTCRGCATTASSC